MKAIITQQDGLYLITLIDKDYKDIFVVDELSFELDKKDINEK
jgi:hypothetical protein